MLSPWRVEWAGRGSGWPLEGGMVYRWHCLQSSAVVTVKKPNQPLIGLCTVFKWWLFKLFKSLHAGPRLPQHSPLLAAWLCLPMLPYREEKGPHLNLSIEYVKITWNRYSAPVSTMKGIMISDYRSCSAFPTYLRDPTSGVGCIISAGRLWHHACDVPSHGSLGCPITRELRKCALWADWEV